MVAKIRYILLFLPVMKLKNNHLKIIFGLKVKQLRTEKGLSGKALASAAEMSVSYLNEIEKGKKYPKEEKIEAIAAALEIPVKELIEVSLPRELGPLEELLNSNFLNELPLDLFGIELSKVVEIIANAPKRVGAFISTLVDLGRNYALAEENFYFGVLRSYLEMHNNYFEGIETEVEQFTKKYKVPTKGKISVELLAKLLEQKFNYTIEPDGLSPYAELKDLRSVFVPKKKRLLMNGGLTDVQTAFQYGKELGFNALNLVDRANTSSLVRVNTFEEVLNHFKANYFAAALLINKNTFIGDMESFLGRPTWDGEALSKVMEKYQASPEMLLQRLTNLLPEYFGLDNIFLLRFIHTPADNTYIIDKELHLNQRHHPHSNGLYEHYCRRWLAISLLSDLYSMQKKGKYAGTIVGAQISKYYNTEDEYFCITFARPAYPSPDKNVSVTVGILLDENTRTKIGFLDDPSISYKVVNQTCERCPIEDCEERAARPKVVQARNYRKKVDGALKTILEK